MEQKERRSIEQVIDILQSIVDEDNMAGITRQGVTYSFEIDRRANFSTVGLSFRILAHKETIAKVFNENRFDNMTLTI